MFQTIHFSFWRKVQAVGRKVLGEEGSSAASEQHPSEMSDGWRTTATSNFLHDQQLKSLYSRFPRDAAKKDWASKRRAEGVIQNSEIKEKDEDEEEKDYNDKRTGKLRTYCSHTYSTVCSLQHIHFFFNKLKIGEIFEVSGIKGFDTFIYVLVCDFKVLLDLISRMRY